MSSYEVNDNSAIYYGSNYWNDIAPVAAEINRRLSGDPERHWFHRFQELVGARRFARALVLNCGNGHVERGLFAAGLIESCVGIDYSEALLEQARADNAHLPATYVQMDVNTAAFPGGPFDLVVNFAAGHHIARIDKVFRALCELLDPDAWFVSYDYVGPHRNQYDYEIWDAAHQVNRTLPADARQDLGYPHLPTMLVTDPTEAVHSELILETFGRYFELVERRDVGGAIGYLLLTMNDRLFAVDEAERDRIATDVMTADLAHLESHPDQVLFAYFAGRPRKEVLRDAGQLRVWSADEDAREARAVADGGEYYPRTALQDVWLELADERLREVQHEHRHELAEHELTVLRAEIAAVRATFPLPQWERLQAAGSSLATRTRAVGRSARGALRRIRRPVDNA